MKFLLVVLYLVALLLPLALAWASGMPPRPFMDELASGAGLLAFSIILVEFVLSGRFRAISAPIGMDITMRIHQLMARSAVVLALIHPFLYVSPFNPPQPGDPARVLSLTWEFHSIFSGIIAWVLLPVLVLMAIGQSKMSYKYEAWRLLHGLGAVVIAGMTLHHATHAGRYSDDPNLLLLWQIMFGVALLSVAWVYVIRPVMQVMRPWKVASVRNIATRTWEVMIEPDGHSGLGYRAGQFAWLNIGSSPFALHENPFSIASAPGSGKQVGFVIKELGDFTSTIGQVQPGTRAYLDGPHGHLVTDASAAGIAMVAGGVGIAPMLGILGQLRIEKDTRPSMLIYGNRCADQIADRDALEAQAKEHGTQLVHVLSEPPAEWSGETGLVDKALIEKLFKPEMKDWLFILCGPPAMMEGVEETLIALGVPTTRILSERFHYD